MYQCVSLTLLRTTKFCQCPLLFAFIFFVTTLAQTQTFISQDPSYSTYSANTNNVSGGSLGKQVNAPKEDYASWVVYAQTLDAADTLFFTSARPLPTSTSGIIRKDRTASVFYAVRDPNIRLQAKLPINEGWSVALPYQNTGSLNRATHGATVMLSGNRSILAGERSISVGSAVGTSYMLDLFELNNVNYSRYDEVLKGPTNGTRIMTLPIEAANTDSTWESQPTVSVEGGMNQPTSGKTLFFVSNRPEFPGDSTDDMNIWFIQRNINGTWSEPKLVPDINTPGDEISPHCGADGNFYFSSTWNYSANRLGTRGQEIFRCRYRDSVGILLPTSPVNLDTALMNDVRQYSLGAVGTKMSSNSKVNKKAVETLSIINSDADDCFPFITPDGRFLFLTSNRNGSQELDLYAFSIPKPRIRLRINVREIEVSAEGKPISEPHILEGVSVRVRNTATDAVAKIPSATDDYFLEPEKTYSLSLDTLLKEHCYTNSLKGDEIITLTTTQPRNADTLYISEFTILKQQKPIPRLEFVPTEAVAFFITGYWKPTTKENLAEFRARHRKGFFSNSIFVDSTDLQADEAETKSKRRTPTAATTFRQYDDVAAQIDLQFDREFGRLAEALAKVETLRFWEDRVSCGRDTLMLKMTVRGYTDRRGLRDGYYSDVPVAGKDRTGKVVMIPTNDRIMRQTSALLDSGQRGNIKLSVLRARFMAEAFHRWMLRRDSAQNIYRNLFESNRILPPEIIGMGFDKERFAQTGNENDLYSRRIEMSFDLVRRSTSIPSPIATNTIPTSVLSKTSITTSVVTSTATLVRPPIVSSVSATVIPDTTQSLPPVFVPLSVILSTGNALGESLEKSAPLQTKPLETITDSTSAANRLNDRLNETPSERCYTVMYTSIEGNKLEAIRLRDLLLAQKVSDARVDVYINPVGKRFYRVCSGCFANDYEAFAFLKTLPSMREVLSLTTKPVVIRM